MEDKKLMEDKDLAILHIDIDMVYKHATSSYDIDIFRIMAYRLVLLPSFIVWFCLVLSCVVILVMTILHWTSITLTQGTYIKFSTRTLQLQSCQ